MPAAGAALAWAVLLLLGVCAPRRADAQTSAIRLAVPFVAQTEDLCGGASAAMLFRFWGDRHAPASQFAALIDRAAGGIADTDLVDAIRTRRWNAERLDGSIAVLTGELDARRPPMLLLEDRPGRYHYVVAVGIDEHAVFIHDPTWGPDRRVPIETLQRAWKPSGFWTLRVTPTSSTLEATAVPTTTSRVPARTACDARLDAALDDIAAHGLEVAETRLDPLIAACPGEAGPLRELAGVRFAQQRWEEASTLAAAALALAPQDAYAADVLGSSLFLRHDDAGALRAWNRAGTPLLDAVRISGLSRTRYAQVTEALGLPVDSLLTARAFALARRRLEQFPVFASTRLSLRPDGERYTVVDAVVVERRVLPGGPLAWGAAAVRAALERELTATLPGWRGQGDTWSASLGWWTHRPFARLTFAAPFTKGPRGVWRVDAEWERETYQRVAPADVQEDRVTGSLGLSSWLRPGLRADAAVSLDAWQHTGSNRFRTLAVHAGIEQRFRDDRVAVMARAAQWIPMSAIHRFSAARAAVEARTSRDARRFVLSGTVGGSLASAAAPLALWNGAGDGRGRAPLLRAHRLLDDGRIGGPVFGRRVMFGSVEAQHWLPRPALVRVAAAVFADAALAAERAPLATGRPRQVDVGAGLRVRPPGAGGTLRFDYARGLRDGAVRCFIGWQQD